MLKRKGATAPLPKDVMELEILSKLPAKSLKRFRCVSKNWYALITADSYFITTHMHRMHQHSSSILLFTNPKNGLLTSKILLLNRDLSQSLDLDISYLRDRSSCLISQISNNLGYCKGLICFEHYSSPIILWNPATREYRYLPKPLPSEADDRNFSRHSNSMRLGLGFDDENKDYKLVRIMQRYNDEFHETMVSAQIFSLSSNTWRHVNKGLPFYNTQLRSREAVYGDKFCTG